MAWTQGASTFDSLPMVETKRLWLDLHTHTDKGPRS